MINIRERKNPKGVYLYLDVYYNKKRTTRATGLRLTGDPQLDQRIYYHAEKMAAELTLELAKYNFNVDVLRPGFNNFIEFYERIAAERPDYTRRANVLQHMKNFSGRSIAFDKINQTYWERFKRYLLNDVGLAGTTVFTMYGILKSLLNRAVREKLIFENPLDNVIERRPRSERKFLTYNDLSKLIKHECIDPEVKEAFLFSCYTGIRLGDMYRLSWDNIKDDTIRIVQGKTKNFVSIPLTAPAKDLLDNRVRRKGIIFDLPVKSVLSTVVKTWATSGGFPGITFHCARHTFATLALTFGASIESVSDMLGHTDIKTTRIYARILDEKKKYDAAKFPRFDSPAEGDLTEQIAKQQEVNYPGKH